MATLPALFMIVRLSEMQRACSVQGHFVVIKRMCVEVHVPLLLNSALHWTFHFLCCFDTVSFFEIYALRDNLSGSSLGSTEDYSSNKHHGSADMSGYKVIHKVIQ